MATSKTYNDAVDIADRASRVFQAVLVAYRAGEIDDDALLTAKAVADEANAVFDLAWDAEAVLAEAEPEEPKEEHPPREPVLWTV